HRDLSLETFGEQVFPLAYQLIRTLFHDRHDRIGDDIRIMADTRHLPRYLAARDSAADLELVILFLTFDIQIRHGRSDRFELVTHIGIERVEICRELHYGIAALVEYDRAVV